MATVAQGSIKYASIACAIPTQSYNLLSDGTRYCMENITRKDEKFAGAVVKGLIWTVIDEHVLRKYPALLRVFDASRNASSHVATPESEVVGMNKLFLLWAKDEEAGKGCILR